uniref:Uncharacterized protein n=1 Tax=Arundo donax TaxID=35708 RepID=A0A0A9H7P9_ARUDO
MEYQIMPLQSPFSSQAEVRQRTHILPWLCTSHPVGQL